MLLSEYIPMISEENGNWRVKPAPVPKKPRALPLDPSHLAGYTLSDGTTAGEVDEKGAFIQKPVV